MFVSLINNADVFTASLYFLKILLDVCVHANKEQHISGYKGKGFFVKYRAKRYVDDMKVQQRFCVLSGLFAAFLINHFKFESCLKCYLLLLLTVCVLVHHLI